MICWWFTLGAAHLSTPEEIISLIVIYAGAPKRAVHVSQLDSLIDHNYDHVRHTGAPLQKRGEARHAIIRLKSHLSLSGTHFPQDTLT